MTAGRIIFLNGTSSSGKSSIARELLDILDDGVFFHLAVDSFNAMRTKRDLAQENLDTALRRTRMGFHRSIAAMAEVGNDVIADHVLSEPWRLIDFLPCCPQRMCCSSASAAHWTNWSAGKRYEVIALRVSRHCSTTWSMRMVITTSHATPAQQTRANAPS